MPQLDSTPTISIITIVKNGREFIGQTIASVLAQTYKSVEYIVIDGGSTDGTIDVIKSFETSISCWVSENDEGIADAFNKGLSRANGDYILFLNSDDALAAPEVLAAVVQEIIDNRFPVLIYGDCNVLDRSSGRVIYRANIDFNLNGLRRGQMLPQPSLFTHRSYFEKYGVFDKQFRIAMDYEWLLRGGAKERVVHIPLLVTNVRNGGVSTLNRARTVDEIVLALKKNGYISSKWSEASLRGYFFSRLFVRKVLESIGFCEAFNLIRKRFASRVDDGTAGRGCY